MNDPIGIAARAVAQQLQAEAGPAWWPRSRRSWPPGNPRPRRRRSGAGGGLTKARMHRGGNQVWSALL